MFLLFLVKPHLISDNKKQNYYSLIIISLILAILIYILFAYFITNDNILDTVLDTESIKLNKMTKYLLLKKLLKDLNK
jgi:phosphotransferase system  glucose/maltose/N-acetylglucosamine-specific IIC component